MLGELLTNPVLSFTLILMASSFFYQLGKIHGKAEGYSRGRKGLPWE
jgi:hypothetical protein